MIKAILYTLLLLPIGFSALAQTKDEQAVTAAVEELRKALVDPDKAVLDRLTAEDLSYGHSNGNIQDKTVFIASLTTPGQLDFVDMSLTEQTIKIVKDIAIVRHHLFSNTNDGGKPGTAKLAVLQIWQKQKGQWKLLARQATKI